MGGWVVYTWRAAVAGIEAVTALCAALNLAYFLHRVSSVDSPSRRAAAFVLALISLGSLAESVVVIGSLETNGFVPLAAPASWIVARAITLAGTGFISALILKGDRQSEIGKSAMGNRQLAVGNEVRVGGGAGEG